MDNRKEIILLELKKLSKKKNISLDDNIKEIGIDSLDLAELVFEAEAKFGVELSDEQLAEIKTVKDIISIFSN
ncbi:acyl carrier protein [Mycoplasmopsis verecunda]|uniref:Acyl carrier protein n=1 Tax=Mycoplasmopsis verecunda TaxID=171291 RepID=A0A1T4KTK7_9BACT|nr:acyl carrier protein [Mycoplasmopsis verecunda]WPB54656.1 acyl carrier protein [Mycoplasmopsis verecunda]SJZ45759.1 acyl carrier protein [Mycoplasmopsis verecunda]